MHVSIYLSVRMPIHISIHMSARRFVSDDFERDLATHDEMSDAYIRNPIHARPHPCAHTHAHMHALTHALMCGTHSTTGKSARCTKYS